MKPLETIGAIPVVCSPHTYTEYSGFTYNASTQTLSVVNVSSTAVSFTSFAGANHDHQSVNGGGVLNAAAIGSGTIATARLGSGSASAATFLRGDQTWATPPGGSSANVGTTTVNFGSFPGCSDTSVSVTGQAGILAGSVVNAWIYPSSTADHTADEHIVETIQVYAGNIVAGVGFTIYARNTSQLNEPLSSGGVTGFRPAAGTVYGEPNASVGGKGTRIYGSWSVAWQWS